MKVYVELYNLETSWNTRLDNLESFIRAFIDPNYKIVRPSEDYPWSSDQFYQVWDQQLELISQNGFAVLRDSAQSSWFATNDVNRINEGVLDQIAVLERLFNNKGK